ncbi:MAG: HEPN domain-containing protein [Chitinophagaceae bacterium]
MQLNYNQHHPYTQPLPDHNGRLAAIADKIISLVNPNKLFLVNSISASCYYTGSCCAQSMQLPVHYNLMVITGQATGLSEVQETIEQNCRTITPVTALVLPQVVFDDQLLKNECFSNSILLKGSILYNSGHSSFEQLAELPDIKDIGKENCEALKRANGFLASSELHLLRNELPLAAFMLHQAIEQFCFGKILMCSGLNPKTHNLDKLYRLLRFFTFQLVQLFPRDTESEEKLFALVKDAYIMSRYSSRYKVQSTEVRAISNRLRALLQL